ncbi:MAG: nuclear transport factor 2 family protein [Acidobacteria bacterium]|nr:nuclear transport factor 2 family protein [Acidobacteriota bacterium]
MRCGNADGFPVADGIRFEDPLTNGPQEGKAAFLEFVAPMPNIIQDIHILRSWVDGQSVIVQWDAHTVAGVIPVMELFTVVDGLVCSSRAYFDPRPLTNPS